MIPMIAPRDREPPEALLGAGGLGAVGILVGRDVATTEEGVALALAVEAAADVERVDESGSVERPEEGAVVALAEESARDVERVGENGSSEDAIADKGSELVAGEDQAPLAETGLI
ncbi:MAG: hypothetical protein Q9157_004685 [Trypethelium eluteriae]